MTQVKKVLNGLIDRSMTIGDAMVLIVVLSRLKTNR